jgi:hypothetical protein
MIVAAMVIAVKEMPTGEEAMTAWFFMWQRYEIKF